ncbi:MAG TPA: lipid II flippase MurJ [Terracidiphilus sp.]|jgi:putative peptidoglycan lipid II flippase
MATTDRGIAEGLLPVQPRATNRRIFRAAVSVAIAGAAVKLAATGKEIVVAGFYGRSDAMDAFLVAFLIPNLLINLIAESMNQALIPTLIRVRLQEGQERARQLLSNATLTMCAMLTAAALVMAASARLFFPLLAANFSSGKLDLAIRLFYAMLPCVVLGGVASNCTAVLNTVDRFAWPALTPLVISVLMVGGTLAWHRSLGIWALALATVAGMALQAAMLAAGVRSHGYRLTLQWSRHDTAASEVTRQLGPMILSSLVASGGLLVDQAMAAMLPAGSVSALVFAGRFVSVAATLLAGSISSAVAPHFSELVAGRDWTACRAALRTWALRTALVSTPIAAVLIVGAHPLVRVTLQHGAFAAHDTSVVAEVLAMYAIQIPFFAVSRVFIDSLWRCAAPTWSFTAGPSTWSSTWCSICCSCAAWEWRASRCRLRSGA